MIVVSMQYDQESQTLTLTGTEGETILVGALDEGNVLYVRLPAQIFLQDPFNSKRTYKVQSITLKNGRVRIDTFIGLFYSYPYTRGEGRKILFHRATARPDISE